MSYKFGRNYLLSVGTVDIKINPTGLPILIELPFTIEFEIVRNILSSANHIHLRIYNLAAQTRNLIRYNFYNTGERRPIFLYAGYGQTALPLVFSGNITQAFSVREGSNFVTTIEALDGGFAFANAFTNTSFLSGTPQLSVIQNIAGQLSNYGVGTGYVGSFPGTIGRGNVYSGPTGQILYELTNGGFFIDNGKINCLGNNEYVPGGLSLVNANSGLLGTPVLEQTILTFDMLFEPAVIAGQQIMLQSSTDLSFNGMYKIISIKHHGTISAAVCGDAVTSLQMFWGPAALVPGVPFTSVTQ